MLFGSLFFTSLGRAPAVFYISIPLTGFSDGSLSPGVILGAVGET